ncbi:Hypothetical protein, putative [Bodo saltans]|uniref:Uncharacterized protein n=1 Tax=Bodo saltans TaxID=75058 RepID=A0A0S4J8U2_BODSA|nr:Hypothetical protein, putative [Bodo saltans]|eukprot:CUG86645.1 Hypothetical protein, putative [Bodo saltans]
MSTGMVPAANDTRNLPPSQALCVVKQEDTREEDTHRYDNRRRYESSIRQLSVHVPLFRYWFRVPVAQDKEKTQYLPIEVQQLTPACLYIKCIACALTAIVVRSDKKYRSPLTMRVSSDPPSRRRGNHHSNNDDDVVDVEDFRRVVACLGVIHGLTCGGELWSIGSLGDDDNSLFDVQLIPFCVPRSCISVYNVAADAWDSASTHIAREESHLMRQAEVLRYISRGTPIPVAYGVKAKLLREQSNNNSQYEVFVDPLGQDSVSHPQCVLLRALAKQGQLGCFNIMTMNYRWKNDATCAMPTHIKLTCLNTGLLVADPVISATVYPLRNGRNYDVLERRVTNAQRKMSSW